MKKVFLFLLSSISYLAHSQELITKFEQTKATETVTYQEGIAYFQQLDKRFPQIKMFEMGPTDSGYPLHLVVFSNDGDFDFKSLRRKGKCLILFNNGIHPGEPDGIDASQMLFRDLALKKNGKQLPDNVVLAMIPFYNIGGTLNRNSYSRANQNGPAAFGFRGNAQNLDLNRDFIKSDSKNAKSFAAIFHQVDPEVFVDYHVSNGADYQHVMTMVTTQHSKLGGEMGEFLNQTFEPGIYETMKGKGWDMVPYVNHFGATPDSGWVAFNDSPRYSSGYASLFQTFSFLPETHMLKPYAQRVQATYDLMLAFLDFTSQNAEKIKGLRRKTREAVKAQKEFALAWKADMKSPSYLTYKGYQAGYKPSEVSGLPRLYYDRTKSFERKVKFFNRFEPTNIVQKPEAYLIPQGWHEVIDRLKINGVTMQRLPKDTLIAVEVYRVDDYKSQPRPFEKHHLNYDLKLTAKKQTIRFLKGDYVIPMNQIMNRYLMETLEPTGGDSFFTWNFFDAILQAKEGYSDYVFEDLAAEILRKNPDLKVQLDKKKSEDAKFAQSASAQLDFVYRNSPWYEPEHLRYPVFRLVK